MKEELRVEATEVLDLALARECPCAIHVAFVAPFSPFLFPVAT